MSFNNSGFVQNPPFNIAANLSAIPRPVAPAKNLSLNSPMIERVYKAKSGCSACGKKVA